MDIAPLSPTIGVELGGVDISVLLSPGASGRLKALLAQHRLLLFRGLDINAEDQVGLVSAIVPAVRERPDDGLATLVTTKPNELISGDYAIPFHSDYAYTPNGALDVVSLRALVLEQPEPTSFANMVHAAGRLPASLRDRLRELMVLQCQDFAPQPSGVLKRVNVGGSDRAEGRPTIAPDGETMVTPHPAIRRHPRTGEEVLTISAGMTSHFVGVSARENDALFDALEPYRYDPSGIYTHSWQKGDLLLWDNIALQHGRAALKSTGERTLRRVIGNARPLI